MIQDRKTNIGRIRIRNASKPKGRPWLSTLELMLEMLEVLHLLKLPGQLGSLLPLTLLQMGVSSGLPLFPCLSWKPCGTRTRADSETFIGEPSLQDAADNIQGASLNDAGPNGLASPNADVYYALKS